MRVINEARVDYKYKLCSSCPEIYKTIFSNTVVTTIIPKLLCIEKSVDKIIASKYDILTYTITIKNISDFTLKNLFFEDLLPKNLKFISNSITLNGETLYCMTLKRPIYLGSIYPNGKIIISFKALITNECCTKNICNFSTIYFDYIYNIEEAPVVALINSNTVCTVIEKILFHQFALSKTIPFSKFFFNSNTLIDLISNIDIINYKLIATPITYNHFHKEKNLCNILVIAKITYKLYFSKNYCTDKVYHHTYIEGFSTLLAIPCSADLTKIRHINIYTENLSYSIIDDSILFINSDLLLEL